ncbi:hypothetical protein P40081_01130 [Paenibacillus sp. FSL P4-0081]|jgi:hypothetical protein|uniref:hypothetical protein n=1 Tax=Paenibacillus sp. FSL P4-0081 TaxID=1536769 RepID=UPI0004F79ED5|nr:hypothetical protein [Paenibacillus sp. FSL P4-0081]AIQ26965.1 hypothetical protein P40081_01130 [Paenibacillus sp. FSL P4-0081]
MANLQDLQGTQTLREAWPKIEQNEQAINSEVINHKTSSAAHAAESITYSGPVAGAANIKQAVDSHVESEAAHAAEHITYNGTVQGAANIKQAIDSESARITNLVVNAGDSGPEARDARVSGPSGITYSTLKMRLDAEMTNLINFLNYMPINGGDFDGSDPSGPVIDGGTY